MKYGNLRRTTASPADCKLSMEDRDVVFNVADDGVHTNYSPPSHIAVL